VDPVLLSASAAILDLGEEIFHQLSEKYNIMYPPCCLVHWNKFPYDRYVPGSGYVTPYAACLEGAESYSDWLPPDLAQLLCTWKLDEETKPILVKLRETSTSALKGFKHICAYAGKERTSREPPR
jgi:hypothetical protein